MSDWHRFGSPDALDHALAEYIGALLEDAFEAAGEASLAVSGGNTPRQLFRLLSRLELDWSKVTITLVDERQVSPVSEDSNERLVRENLLQNRAGSANFIGLHSDSADALPELARRVAAIPRPFTLIILGMGADGHTASWFPRASNLHTLLDRNNPAELASSDPVTAPYQRTTLTLAAVLRSREIIVHICGEEKAAVLAEATARRYPIAAVLEQDSAPVSIWWAP